MTTAERITTLFSFVQMHILLIICGALIIGTVVALIFLEKARRKASLAKRHLKEMQDSEAMRISENYDITSSKHLMHDEYVEYEKEAKKLSHLTPLCFLATFILFLSILTVVSVFDTYHIAQKHGYYKGLDASATQLWHHIHRSPEEDKVPDDLHGKIIIYYRFGCPDCSAVYPQLTEKLKEYKNVYWISTRSAQGKELIAKYPVKEVPSVLYVKHDDTYATAIIYSTIDKESYLDEDILNDFLNMVAYDRANYTDTK